MSSILLETVKFKVELFNNLQVIITEHTQNYIFYYARHDEIFSNHVHFTIMSNMIAHLYDASHIYIFTFNE
jgi:hypothetical protein